MTAAFGGTGGCDPSSLTPVVAIFGGTGGCEPSNIHANACVIFGGTGGCEPSNNTNLGGTGGCEPSMTTVNVSRDEKLLGAKLTARPRITNRNTTALAVGFIAISSFLVSGAFQRAATVQWRRGPSVARREMLGMQSRNRSDTRIRWGTSGWRSAGNRCRASVARKAAP
jgi:hypothetical protein